MGIFSNSTIGSSNVVEPSTKGDLVTFSNTPVNLPVGSDDEVLTAISTEPTGLRWKKPKAELFLTSKGDLLTSTGTNINKKGLGLLNQTLVADPSSALGFNWENPKINTIFNCGLLEIFNGNLVSSLTQEIPITFYNTTLVNFDNAIVNVQFRIPKTGILTNISMQITSLNLENSGQIKLTLQRSTTSDVDVFTGINSTGFNNFTGSDIVVTAGELVNWKITKTTGAIDDLDLVKVSFLQLTYRQTQST